MAHSRSRSVSSMARSQSRSRVLSQIDPLQLEAPIVLLDLVTSDMADGSSSSCICVGQLFSTKKLLHMKLSNIAIRDKFEFKMYKSTTVRYENRCTLDTCKW